MYVCLKKAATSDISSKDEWWLGISYYISRLFPDLDKIAFYTLNTFLPIKKDDDDGLLALGYAVTIAEGDSHTAAIEFEENDKMIEHYNDNMFPAKKDVNRIKFYYVKRKYQRDL